MGVSEGKSAQKCRFCAREEGKVASGSVTVVWNAKPWPGMQTRGPEMQEGGLNLGHPLGWLRVCCGERCNLASRQWGCWAAKLRSAKSAGLELLRTLRTMCCEPMCCERCDARAEPMRCERCAANDASAALRQRRRVSCTPPGPLLQSW